LTGCLALTGCSAFGKKPSAPASAATRPTFDPGLPARVERGGNPAPTPPLPDPGPPAGASGLLAGQVVDSYNRRPPQTYIEVRGVPEPGEPNPAPIEVAADAQGYFTIQGLKPGRRYQLTARGHDGERLLAGTTWATAPNPKVLIRVSEDLATRNTPPLPAAPAWNGQPAPPAPPATPGAAQPPPPSWPSPPTPPPQQPPTGGTAQPAPGPASPGISRPQPAAEIGPPVRETPASPPPAPPAPPARPVNPANIAADPKPLAQFVPPTVSIPGAPALATVPGSPAPAVAAAPVPAPIPWPTAPGKKPPPASPGMPVEVPAAVPPPAAAPQQGRPQVPSCVLVGHQLHNFALTDLNGQPWEFRQRRGRLVLLDFWGTWCRPCQEAIPHLRILQQQFGPYGLEVIGIAYESGNQLQQIQAVSRVSSRLRINYRLLLGGERGKCPVLTQFGVGTFPTLVLLDERGQIIWRGEGAEPHTLRELDLVLRQRLGVR
jgi:thiol-disulfide isomerase/thioredoxin